MPYLWVKGVVATRHKRPYVQLANDNQLIAQLSIAEARNLAIEILQMAARTEADAMIVKFFAKSQFPPEVAAAFQRESRDFRAELDSGAEPIDEPSPE